MFLVSVCGSSVMFGADCAWGVMLPGTDASGLLWAVSDRGRANLAHGQAGVRAGVGSGCKRDGGRWEREEREWADGCGEARVGQGAGGGRSRGGRERETRERDEVSAERGGGERAESKCDARPDQLAPCERVTQDKVATS